jgi:hypothetical protein
MTATTAVEYGTVIWVEGKVTVFTFDCKHDAMNFARNSIHIQGIEKIFVFSSDETEPLFQFKK